MRFIQLLPLLIVSVHSDHLSWPGSDASAMSSSFSSGGAHARAHAGKWDIGKKKDWAAGTSKSDQQGNGSEKGEQMGQKIEYGKIEDQGNKGKQDWQGDEEQKEERGHSGEEQNDEEQVEKKQKDEDAKGQKHGEHEKRKEKKMELPPPRKLSHSGEWDSSSSSSGSSSSSSSKEDYSEEIVAGLDTLRPINERSCMHEELKLDKDLSSPVECARTCHKGGKPKICYYKFVVERYTVSGQACDSCFPNDTNSFCSNCQCVPANGVEKMGLTVNRMIPGPTIDVCLGDMIVVDVVNQAKGQAVTIHWHGVFQRGYQYYDGVPFLTQCPIHDTNSFRYQFAANNPGTHFWHAHTGLQKLDGLFGALVIRKPVETEKYGHFYDYDLSEHIININDWIHETSSSRYPGYNSGSHVGQHPDSILINGKGQYLSWPKHNRTKSPLAVFTVEPHKRYRFRLVNSFCTVCPGQITIEKHPLYVIESDGNPVEPVTVDSINSWAGERYDFILTANQKPGTYWIQVRGIGPCTELKVHQLAILQYKGITEPPSGFEPSYEGGVPSGLVLNPMSGVCNPSREDEICISNLRNAEEIDKGILKEHPDLKFFIPIRFYQFEPKELFKPQTYESFMIPVENVTLTSTLDGITFQFPPSPPLSQFDDVPKESYCNGDMKPKNCHGKRCKCTHVIEADYGKVVELILVDEFQAPNISHPFHLHGHAFTVMSMGQPFNAGAATDNSTNSENPNSDENQTRRGKINLEYAMELDRNNGIKRCFDQPAVKDTLMVPHNGFAVIRFRANNPGFWLFHCHFLYHQMVGMDMVIRVGKQSDLPPVPEGFPKCGNYKPKIRKNKYRTEF